MSTRAISRPYEATLNRRPYERDHGIGNPPPPDPAAWFAFLCQRCETLFKVQACTARHCATRLHAAAAKGIQGSETIGEASGA